MRKITAMLGALALVLLVPVAALGHGELESEIPEAGSKVNGPPSHLILNFTEPPTKDAVFKVEDGCGRDVLREAFVEGNVGHVFLEKGGQPGKWEVSYEVVSATDGHETSGSYPLTVTGKADCSKPPPDKEGDGGANGGAAAPTGANQDDDDGGSFPVLPVGLGVIAVIALALIARRAAG